MFLRRFLILTVAFVCAGCQTVQTTQPGAVGLAATPCTVCTGPGALPGMVSTLPTLVDWSGAMMNRM